MKAAMVWNLGAPGLPHHGAYIGTHFLHHLVGMDYLWWPDDVQVSTRVRDYDVLIVHLFASMRHVEQIKAVHPAAIVVALPDSYMDEVFAARDAHQEARYLAQLQAADVIGYVSESNRQFYGALLGKPMVRIPMPIGTDAFFAELRATPKQAFIITQDHGPRIVDYTVQNVAALVEIQRRTGLPVLYFNAREQTRFYAAQVGLKATFGDYVNYQMYVQMAAAARLGVDLYARHGFGRNEISLAYAGTPCVGSRYTDVFAGLPKFDPWFGLDAAEFACYLLNNPSILKTVADEQYCVVERNHSVQAVKRAMDDALERMVSYANDRAANH